MPEERVDPVPCIVCGRRLDPVMGSILPTKNQPYAGTVFDSHGHYGSTAWDPMGIDSTPRLEINVCDPCLVKNQSRVLVVTSRPAPTEETYMPWPEAPYAYQPPRIEEVGGS